MQLNRTDLAEAYRRMRRCREFEDRIHLLNEKGEVPGFIHLSAGQEANAVAICMHLSDADYIASTHRGHGHALAKGCDVVGLNARLKTEGVEFERELGPGPYGQAIYVRDPDGNTLELFERQ